MSVTPRRGALAGVTVLLCTALAACGSFNDTTRRMASAVTPYKIEIVQGNFVSREQVEALRAGMGRNQVRDILGTPLLASVFHGDRWDYVFTLKRQGVEPQSRRLTVYFKDDALERWEGDEMPTEAEFVGQLGSRRARGTVPVLEVPEEKLRQFQTGDRARPAAGGAGAAPDAAAPAPARSYPPLESGAVR